MVWHLDRRQHGQDRRRWFRGGRRVADYALATVLSTSLVGLSAAQMPMVVSPSTVAIAVGQTTVLTVTGAPGVVQWSSSNPIIATVNQAGLVTGVSAGAVTISVKSRNQRSASTVTILQPPPPQEICGNGLDDDGDGLIDETCPPPPSAYGPQLTITCPAGSVDIWPGTHIATVVNNASAGTSFCLRAGVHVVDNQITPKSGDTFTGEYGAVLDASSWVSTDMGNTGLFRTLNQDVDDVTIRNLVIRNVPGFAIAGFYQFSDRWTIDHNDISGCKRGGVSPPNASVVSHNAIHHNVGDLTSPIANENGGGYNVFHSDTVLFLDNEIAFNGPEQKSSHTANVTFRGNYVHDNLGAGIWYDGDNPGSLVEDNRIEDNGLFGIIYEISSHGVIRNNVIKRSRGWQGISLVTSKDFEVYGNTIEDSGRGISLYLFCPAPIGGGTTGWDLADNYVHDNVIIVGIQSGDFANSFFYSGCTAEQIWPYLDGTKNNRFVHNRYIVPALTGAYWMWGDTTMMRTWAEWQAFGQDLTGTLQVR